jgi:hypothetical protein
VPIRDGAQVLLADRGQWGLRPGDVDSLLAEEHRARLVRGFVERQEMSAL